MYPMMKHILFTGGGSAGHITPNIALIKKIQSLGWRASYVGTGQSIEHTLIEPLKIPYYVIDSGKFARQFTFKNFLSPFKVLHGIWQAFWLCRKLKPNIVFSKGGFVAVPLVVGAWLNHIPVIAHESDLTPGLANRLCYPFVQKIALSFSQSERYFKDKKKLVYTGTPIREEMLKGDIAKGKKFLNFSEEKPILFVYGGSLGSSIINEAVWAALPELLKLFNIAHCCGKGKTNSTFDDIKGYCQFEYLNQELPDVMAASELVISRAGANSIYELLTLHKPHLLIPLSKKASRGDQIDNAKYFSNLKLSRVLFEEQLNSVTLFNKVRETWESRAEIVAHMKTYSLPNATEKIIRLLT